MGNVTQQRNNSDKRLRRRRRVTYCDVNCRIASAVARVANSCSSSPPQAPMPSVPYEEDQLQYIRELDAQLSPDKEELSKTYKVTTMRRLRILTVIWVLNLICLLRMRRRQENQPPCATVFFSTVNIVDRFILSKESPKLSPHQIAVGALWLALKFNTSDERNANDWRNDINRLSKGALDTTEKEIAGSMWKIWAALGCSVGWSGPIPHLMWINSVYPLLNCQKRRVMEQAITFLAMTFVDWDVFGEQPDILAYAAYYSALRSRYQRTKFMELFENARTREKVLQVSPEIDKCFNQDVGRARTDASTQLKLFIRTKFGQLLEEEGTQYEGVPVSFGGLCYA